MKQSVAAVLVFTSFICSRDLHAAPAPSVDRLLLKAFAAAYPSAEKIMWTEQKGLFTVHFLDHNVRSVMEYDAKGRMVQSIRYYADPAMLPQNVSWEWHRQFSDKTLFGITEVSDGKTTAWFLKGEDAKQWITVKASADGGMQLVETFDKQL